MSFFGSSLYNLFSKEAERLYTTYNKMVRTTFMVPRETHRYFIEELTRSPHLKVLLSSRLVRFQELLLKSERISINLLAKMNSVDCRTVHGNNLNQIAKECKVNNIHLTSNIVKKNMNYKKVPTTEEWKIALVNELIQLRNGDLNLSNFDISELNEMLILLTTSFKCSWQAYWKLLFQAHF